MKNLIIYDSKHRQSYSNFIRMNKLCLYKLSTLKKISDYQKNSINNIKNTQNAYDGWQILYNI